MSTYAVFGMTREWAVAEARKKIPPHGQGGQPLAQSEWLEMCDEEADRLMDGKRSVQLSPKYDAPAFAYEYLDLAKKLEHRDLKVRAYAIDHTRPIKNGKPSYAWQAVK